MTWNVTCTYSQTLAQKTPTCCVSLSSFYNDTIVPCPACSCGCRSNITHSRSCVKCSLSCSSRRRRQPSRLTRVGLSLEGSISMETTV
ncbi:COBRA-like protein 3 [Linum perenne]